MADLKVVYQRVFLEHSRNPHNSGVVDEATHRALRHNPLCGDTVEVSLRVVGDRVMEVRCKVRGCALCTAASSMMTDELGEASVADALELSALVPEALQREGKPSEADDCAPPLPDSLRPFLAVRQVPSRIGCLTLSFQALGEALAELAR